MYPLSAKITFRRGTFPSSCLSTGGADWASSSLAGCTKTARSSPSARTITWRFRPVTCLFGSWPRPGPPCRSARADWVSMTATLGLGSRPAATRTARRIRSQSRREEVHLPPFSKMVVHSLPGRKLIREHSPLASAFHQVKHGVDQLARIMLVKSKAIKDRLDAFPFCAQRVRGIARAHRSEVVL